MLATCPAQLSYLPVCYLPLLAPSPPLLPLFPLASFPFRHLFSPIPPFPLIVGHASSSTNEQAQRGKRTTKQHDSPSPTAGHPSTAFRTSSTECPSNERRLPTPLRTQGREDTKCAGRPPQPLMQPSGSRPLLCSPSLDYYFRGQLPPSSTRPRCTPPLPVAFALPPTGFSPPGADGGMQEGRGAVDPAVGEPEPFSYPPARLPSLASLPSLL